MSDEKLAKFDCSVTIAVPWIDSYENLYSKPCKIFKAQFKDKMTLMYLEQFPKPNILVSTEITDMRQGSMVVYYCVFIQFPENCPVTVEDLFEATRNGLKKRTNDGNSAWLFKHMDPESIQVTEKIDSDYGNLYKGAQAPVNTRIAEANQQDVNICEELSIDLPKRHQNVHVTNCICIGDVFVYTDHANCEIVSCPFNLNTMLPLRGFSCPLDKQPLDLVVVGTSDVAVMFENSIQEFEVFENGRIIPKKSLNLGINCSIAIWQNVWYLAKFDNDMLLINICDREGKQIKQVNVCQLPDSSISINIQVHLTVRGGIYCSVFNPSYAEELKRHTVYCYDKNGHEIWQFNDEILRRVTGIAIDRYDNIYLANGKKLIIISPDGNYYKLLHDPIQHPSSLFFHDQDKRLISTSKSGNIQILNVNYTNTF